MADSYGIKPGTVPGFAEAGAGMFMSMRGLPEQTVQHMLSFEGGDARAVEHYESAAVSAAQ
jgi:hypothetical protein